MQNFGGETFLHLCTWKTEEEIGITTVRGILGRWDVRREDGRNWFRFVPIRGVKSSREIVNVKGKMQNTFEHTSLRSTIWISIVTYRALALLQCQMVLVLIDLLTIFTERNIFWKVIISQAEIHSIYRFCLVQTPQQRLEKLREGGANA
jgi:hypothetical protein